MRPLILALFVCGRLISQQAEFDVASIRSAGNAIAKPAFDGSRSPAEEDSLVLAVREQLGMKLETEKGVGDRYRIEKAEKPAEN